jgi:hypothetical protein
MTPAELEQMKNMADELSDCKDILDEAKRLGITDPKKPFIIRKLKHNGKIRTLQGNEEIENLIKEHIDKIFNLMPYIQIITNIIQELKGKSSACKKFLKDKLDEGQKIFNVETNYGTVSINSNIAICTSVTVVNQAIEEMKIPLNIMQEQLRKVKLNNRIIFDSNAAKFCEDNLPLRQELGEQMIQIQKECEVFCEEGEYTNEELYYIKLIASRQEFVRSIWDKKREFTTTMTSLRAITRDAIFNGNFPLNYWYREYNICVQGSETGVRPEQIVYDYLQYIDKTEGTNKYEQYKIITHRINIKNKKYRLEYHLNDMDYIQDDWD